MTDTREAREARERRRGRPAGASTGASTGASGTQADAGGSSTPVASGELLPVIQKESDHPCFECAKCCTYVAIEIDAPTTMKEYDYLVWYLYHDGLSVFVDWEGDWFVKFETRCKHLTSSGLCGVYERRPAICKDFDWRECENTIRDEPADKWLFEEAEDFLAWLEKRRPKSFARFRRYMRRKHESGEEPELERVKVTQILPPPGRGGRRPGRGRRAR